ncbi:MAG: DUF4384 domain-containing protein [Magnetococcales bacterium]|nr:DUF4384 domain-containing protein [Magnetococcales bacterium]
MSASKYCFIKFFRWTALGLAACLAASCGTLPEPEKVGTSMQPKTVPVRNLTSFSEALSCMDRLFLEHGKKGYSLTSTNMNDATGKLSLGVKDMLLTTISAMSASSGAIRYIDLDQSGSRDGLDSVNYLTEKMMSKGIFKGEWPTAYIRGSISQVDDTIMSGREGAAITTGVLDIGASRDRSVSAVTMDILLMDMATRTSIPGLHASNMLAVSRSGKGVDAGAKIMKAGIQFNVSQDSAESSGQAVRTLVQLGMIELIGKWTKVPYWTCLEIEGNNPQVRAQLREWYDKMSGQERTKFIQAGLQGSGVYQGDMDGQENETLRSAIAKFQTDRSLVPNGNVSFEVYEALMQGNVKLSAMPSEPPKPPEIIKNPDPIAVRLVAANEKTGTGYKKGDNLVLNLAISRNGYPYCYYRDGDGVIAQIYPNRFQPDKQLQGNQTIYIPPMREPDEKAKFSLTFSKSGVEEAVMCLASDADIGSLLPREWQVKELTPVRAGSLEEIEKTMTERSTRVTSNRPGVQYLKINVR